MEELLKLQQTTLVLYGNIKKTIHDVRTPLVTIKTGIHYVISILNKLNYDGKMVYEFSEIITVLNNAHKAGEMISESLDVLLNKMAEEMEFLKK